MNKEPTKELPNKRSFEERVFARFDAMDTNHDGIVTGAERDQARAQRQGRQ